MATKLFFDTEFTGLHQNTTLISIGIVSEHGHKFYAELNDYDESQVDDWLRENVISKLKFQEPPFGEDQYSCEYRHENNPIGGEFYKSYSHELRCNMTELKEKLTKWLSQFESVEMWSDCLAYDWVLFCNIFGGAFEVPKNVYYIPFDICTLFKIGGLDPDCGRVEFAYMFESAESQRDVFDKYSGNEHNALYDATIIMKCYEKFFSYKIDNQNWYLLQNTFINHKLNNS